MHLRSERISMLLSAMALSSIIYCHRNYTTQPLSQTFLLPPMAAHELYVVVTYESNTAPGHPLYASLYSLYVCMFAVSMRVS